MTIEERANFIADKSDGTVRGAERRRRVYDAAVKMLREVERRDFSKPRLLTAREVGALRSDAHKTAEECSRLITKRKMSTPQFDDDVS